jgi:hypothetical protein
VSYLDWCQRIINYGWYTIGVIVVVAIVGAFVVFVGYLLIMGVLNLLVILDEWRFDRTKHRNPPRTRPGSWM